MPHEPLSTDRPIEIGSDRSFGLVFAAALTIIALLPLRRGEAPEPFAAAAGLAFAAAALLAPARLHALNRLWFAFGRALHKVVNPIVMAILFFGLVTPLTLLFRLFGRDPLGLAFDETATSYWTPRDDASASDMRKQF